MVERKIYPEYAFTANEREKAAHNQEIYNELKEKYKIYYGRNFLKDGKDCDFSQFDIVIGRRPGYNHSVYRIHKCAPSLSRDQLALICDRGSLCFGYMMTGEDFYIFED